MNMRLVVAMTGATGAGFGVALLKRLAVQPDLAQVALLLSPTARRCLWDECGLKLADLTALSPLIQHVDERNLGASVASGSHRHQGMIIIPCSAGTLGRLAAGTSDSLITRAADVCMKERFPLVLCLRETPLNRIHLENMLRLHDAGAVVMPLAPGFYHRPENLEEMMDDFATRALDQLQVPVSGARRWQGGP